MDLWQILGVEPSHDKRTIRRAYAKRVKQCHPEDDPEGFKRLREAYEWALEWAEGRDGRWAEAWENPVDEEPVPQQFSVLRAVKDSDLAPTDTVGGDPECKDDVDEATTATEHGGRASPKQEGVWEVDAGLAEAWRDELLQLLATQGDAAAAARLDALTRHEAMELVQVRHDFEAMMIGALSRRGSLPPEFANLFADRFEVAAWPVNHLGARFEGEVERFLTRLETTSQLWMTLKREAAQGLAKDWRQALSDFRQSGLPGPMKVIVFPFMIFFTLTLRQPSVWIGTQAARLIIKREPMTLGEEWLLGLLRRPVLRRLRKLADEAVLEKKLSPDMLAWFQNLATPRARLRSLLLSLYIAFICLLVIVVLAAALL